MDKLANARNGYPAHAACYRSFLVPLLLSSVAAFAAPLPTAKEVITALSLKHDQVAKLDGGEIIALEIGEATQKELAMGLAIYLPSQPAKLVAYFKSGKLATIDPDIIAQGQVQPDPVADDFKGFGYTFKQSDEARDLLNATAGDRFNLSSAEIQGLALLKRKLAGAEKTALVAAASQHYREILLQRWQAYRKEGLTGIAPYARDGTEASPAKELHTATASSKALESYFPDLYKAWLNHPNKLPSGAEEQFYWLNRKVEDRPTAILSHRVLQTSDTGSVILARQFYVGHSYNSSQLIVGCLPYRNGSVIFYGHRTSTDQVAGIGSSLKHSIGRDQMKGEMTKNLMRLRSSIQSY